MLSSVLAASDVSKELVVIFSAAFSTLAGSNKGLQACTRGSCIVLDGTVEIEEGRRDAWRLLERWLKCFYLLKDFPVVWSMFEQTEH